MFVLNTPKQTYSNVLSMLISQAFHKGESEVEPLVFVEIHENLKSH